MPSTVQNGRVDNIDSGNAVAFKAAHSAAPVDISTHPGLDHLAAGRDQKGARRLL